MSQEQPNQGRRDSKSMGTIFVVDDEPMLLELAVVILEQLGYEIQTFRDPRSALESFCAQRTPPLLVITDYAMHAMNGMELITECRRVHPQQKTLLLSGTVDETVYHNTEVKPDRFLSKPYQAKQLLETVQAMIDNLN